MQLELRSESSLGKTYNPFGLADSKSIDTGEDFWGFWRSEIITSTLYLSLNSRYGNRSSNGSVAVKEE